MKISSGALAHNQLSTVTNAQHHAPPYAIVDGGGERWVMPGWNWKNFANTDPGENLLRAYPIFCAEDLVINGIGLYISTLYGGGGVARLGVYDATLSGNRLTPGALDTDYGTVSITSTGEKIIAVTDTLTSGYHFLAFSHDGTGSGLMIGVQETSLQQSPTSGVWTNITSDVVEDFAVYAAVTDGGDAFPDPFPSIEGEIHIGAMVMRVRFTT